jgi:hypothetical protein
MHIKMKKNIKYAMKIKICHEKYAKKIFLWVFMQKLTFLVKGWLFRSTVDFCWLFLKRAQCWQKGKNVKIWERNWAKLGYDTED